MTARSACGWLKSQGSKPAFSLQGNKDFAFSRRDVEPLLASQVADDAQRTSALPAEADDIRTRLVHAVASGAEIKAMAGKMGVEHREAARWVTKKGWNYRAGKDERQIPARPGSRMVPKPRYQRD